MLTQEREIVVNPVSSLIKGAILSAFTFLTALSIRDALMKSIELAVPRDKEKSLLFVYFFTAVIVLITVLLSFLWSDTESGPTKTASGH